MSFQYLQARNALTLFESMKTKSIVILVFRVTKQNLRHYRDSVLLHTAMSNLVVEQEVTPSEIHIRASRSLAATVLSGPAPESERVLLEWWATKEQLRARPGELIVRCLLYLPEVRVYIK